MIMEYDGRVSNEARIQEVSIFPAWTGSRGAQPNRWSHAFSLRCVMLNSHRPPDTTWDGPVCVVSGVPVWIGRLLWGLSVFRLQIVLSATVLSCRESNSHRRSGRDMDKTVLSCLAWRCELALRGAFRNDSNDCFYTGSWESSFSSF